VRGASGPREHEGKTAVLSWTVVFLIVAAISGLLGFGVAASGATAIARVLFVIFLVALSVSILMPLLQAG
jgi:uncharacterized membrane protein YtjA (UPF0391 family)